MIPEEAKDPSSAERRSGDGIAIVIRTSIQVRSASMFGHQIRVSSIRQYRTAPPEYKQAADKFNELINERRS